ncbi:MAG: hypothetical protein U9Q82_08260 [Chloroflexota bacterium]|nr:hypothetical protein [Chloroflexota bacterium]
MTFLEQSTPDTFDYMIAGYGVLFGVMSIYLVSLFMRFRSLKRNIEMLEELDSSK